MVNANNKNVPWNPNPAVGTRKILLIHNVAFPFRYCPAGDFLMGSPVSEQKRGGNEDLHNVTLTQGFWIMETSVTQAMWQTLMGTNPSYFSPTGQGRDKVRGVDVSDFPVESVNWYECQIFISQLQHWVDVPDGLVLRLPTEAEREWATRAGTTTPYPWGETLNGDKANCDGRYPYGDVPAGAYLERTSAVRSYPPNPWGLFDMVGNVWEWCLDWYGPYGDGPQTDPTGPASGEGKVIRGGSWLNRAERCRAAYRSHYVATNRSHHLGFRLVLGRELLVG